MASFSKFKEEVAKEKVPHLQDQVCIKTFSHHFKADICTAVHYRSKFFNLN